MLSTLFLLVLMGVFLQSVVKISANHIIQLNQLSSAYQAKTALNMSEKILKDYIIANNDQLPEKAEIASSVGDVEVLKNDKNGYDAVITQKNGVQFKKEIEVEHYANDEETDDYLELFEENLFTPIDE